MDYGYVETELGKLPPEMQPTMRRLFRALLSDLRIGHPNGTTKDPMLNLGGTFVHGTTPSTAGHELSLPHGLGRVPYLAWPILRLDTVGSVIVPLTVSRAADDKRVYVTSTSASVAVSLSVEG